MKHFTKVEKIAVRYLVEWGQFGKSDFPDSIVNSYFDLLTGNIMEKTEAVKTLSGYVKGLLGAEKSKEVERELLSCIL